MPPFHQGLFSFNRPDLDQIVPDQSFFDRPDCRPVSPPIAKVAESVRLMTQVAESKRSFDDLKDPQTLLKRPKWPRAARD